MHRTYLFLGVVCGFLIYVGSVFAQDTDFRLMAPAGAGRAEGDSVLLQVNLDGVTIPLGLSPNRAFRSFQIGSSDAVGRVGGLPYFSVGEAGETRINLFNDGSRAFRSFQIGSSDAVGRTDPDTLLMVSDEGVTIPLGPQLSGRAFRSFQIGSSDAVGRAGTVPYLRVGEEGTQINLLSDPIRAFRSFQIGSSDAVGRTEPDTLFMVNDEGVTIPLGPQLSGRAFRSFQIGSSDAVGRTGTVPYLRVGEEGTQINLLSDPIRAFRSFQIGSSDAVGRTEPDTLFMVSDEGVTIPLGPQLSGRAFRSFQIGSSDAVGRELGTPYFFVGENGETRINLVDDGSRAFRSFQIGSSDAVGRTEPDTLFEVSENGVNVYVGQGRDTGGFFVFGPAGLLFGIGSSGINFGDLPVHMGMATIDQLQIPQAGIEAGYVLTADTNGVASWQPPSGGGGSSVWQPSLIPNSIYYDAGNVGIGTQFPTYPFHVQTGGSGGELHNFIINSNGRVGIDTDDPTAALDVRGDVAITGRLSTSSMQFQSSGVQDWVLTAISDTGDVAWQPRIWNRRYVSGDERHYTTYTWNQVGIGTDDPQTMLDVGGDAYIGGRLTAIGGLQIPATYADGYVLTADADGFGTWQPIPTLWDRMGTDTLYTYRKVGIGTSAPQQAFEVWGNAYVSDTLFTGMVATNLFRLTPWSRVSEPGIKGYVLTSDSLGFGTWQPAPPTYWREGIYGEIYADQSVAINTLGGISPAAWLYVNGTRFHEGHNQMVDVPFVVGYEGRVGVNTASVVEGNLFQVNDFYNGANVFNITDDGRVGIGRYPNMGASLEVAKGAMFNTDGASEPFVVKSDWGQHLIHAMTDTSGRVGIGTEYPNYKLDVNGDMSAWNLHVTDIHLMGNILLQGTAVPPNYVLTSDGQGGTYWAEPSGGNGGSSYWTFDAGDSSLSYYDGPVFIGTTDYPTTGNPLLSLYGYTSDPVRESRPFTVLDNGNVGMGTSTPQFPFQFDAFYGGLNSFVIDEEGHVGIGLDPNLDSPISMLDVRGNAYVSDTLTTTTLRVKPAPQNTVTPGMVLAAVDSQGLATWTMPESSPWQLGLAGDIYYDQPVGIGTGGSYPEGLLHVQGMRGNVSSPFVVSSQGAVGIGTAYPQGILHVTEDTDPVRTSLPDSTLLFTGGRLGIGTVNPATKLTIHNNGSIWASGAFNPALPLLSDPGEGAHFLWQPSVSALRVGYLSSDNTWKWGEYNLGEFSIGLGKNVEASGDASIAIGDSASAYGEHAIAIGHKVQASANHSIALGTGVLDDPYGGFLYNHIDNSLAVGFNTDLPTLFVSPGSGYGTKGSVGIGTFYPEGLFYIDADAPFVVDVSGLVGVGTRTPNEALTLHGAFSLEKMAPGNTLTPTTDFGKLYVDEMGDLNYMNEQGDVKNLTAEVPRGTVLSAHVDYIEGTMTVYQSMGMSYSTSSALSASTILPRGGVLKDLFVTTATPLSAGDSLRVTVVINNVETSLSTIIDATTLPNVYGFTVSSVSGVSVNVNPGDAFTVKFEFVSMSQSSLGATNVSLVLE